MTDIEGFGTRIGLERERLKSTIFCDIQNVTKQRSSNTKTRFADVDEERLELAIRWRSVNLGEPQKLSVQLSNEHIARSTPRWRVGEFAPARFEKIFAVAPVTLRSQREIRYCLGFGGER